MTTVRELVTQIGFEVDSKPLNRVNKGLDTLKRNARQAAAVGASAAAGLFGLAKTSANTAENMDRAANRAGLSLERFQELRFAARNTGVEVDKFNGGMREFAVRMGEAAQGEGQAVEALKTLNVSLKDSEGNLKSQDTLLRDVSNAIQDMDNEAQKTALMDQLMGGEGETLQRFLELTDDQMQELSKRADDVGAIQDEDDIDNATEFNQALRGLMSSIRGLKDQVVFDLLPAFTDTVNKLQDWVTENQELIKSNLASFLENAKNIALVFGDAIVALKDGFMVFADAVGGVQNAVRLLIGAFVAFKGIQIAVAIGNIVSGLIGLASQLKITTALTWAMSSPWLAIGGIITGIVAAIFVDWEDLIDFISDSLSSISDFISDLFGDTKELNDELTDVAKSQQKADKTTTETEKEIGAELPAVDPRSGLDESGDRQPASDVDKGIKEPEINIKGSKTEQKTIQDIKNEFNVENKVEESRQVISEEEGDKSNIENIINETNRVNETNREETTQKLSMGAEVNKSVEGLQSLQVEILRSTLNQIKEIRKLNEIQAGIGGIPERRPENETQFNNTNVVESNDNRVVAGGDDNRSLNNNVEVNVTSPVGGAEDQANFIQAAAEETFRREISRELSQIFTNNPTRE